MRARLLDRLALAETFVKEPARLRETSGEAVAVARELEDPAVFGFALAAHLDMIAGPAHVEERLRLAAELIDLATRLANRELEVLAPRFRVVALLDQGNLTAVGVAINTYA